MSWYLEFNLSGHRHEIPTVVTTSISLTLLAAFIAPSLHLLLRLGFQQPIQYFFDTSSHKFFQLPLDYFLVPLYNLFGYSLLSFQNGVQQLSFYQSL